MQFFHSGGGGGVRGEIRQGRVLGKIRQGRVLGKIRHGVKCTKVVKLVGGRSVINGATPSSLFNKRTIKL